MKLNMQIFVLVWKSINALVYIPVHHRYYYKLIQFQSFLGEVYVLDDGGEVDLDLGNYERFLDVTLHSDNNITTGKIFQLVMEKERKGEFLGKTVQGILKCFILLKRGY